MTTEFRLPELGENIAAGDVLKVLVAPGDAIQPDQPVLELETDKATIEVPSPVGGTVKTVHVKPGEKLNVGGLILTVESGAAASAPKPAAATLPVKSASPVAVPVVAPPKTPKIEAPKPEAKPGPPPLPTPPARVQGEVALPRVTVAATPSVRRLARELGLDIHEIGGSGEDGRITEEDVRAYVRERMRQVAPEPAPAPAATSAAAPASTSLPDFSRWGEIERKAMSSVRRKTAMHLSRAWATIPHVTNHDKADITELEQLRKKLEAKFATKISMTAIATKVIASALKVFPQFAASVDMARQEIVYKKYVNVGVAVDTERGLLVPVIRNADTKNIIQLSAEIAAVAERARNRKITLEDLEGGVFTISNLGGIGGTHFSPIVNSPEVAILGISRGRMEPVYINGLFQPRLLLPLSLSYDHRVIDGADAARFLRWLVEALEQAFLLPFEG
ncbi:MAG: 2-oxo acid dehydrogenase subunit E2 [Acidobacteria bacterium]|nr:2-oxo acid dehydrogenase subunit E2 [Acidobacteriota bacterium]